MTIDREDIIRMAREAGMVQDYDCFFSPGDQDMDVHITDLERFAALIEARAAEREREAIMDEWWMCVQSDLENGVKSLNERAAEKWRKEYPEMARFGDVVRGRKENT